MVASGEVPGGVAQGSYARSGMLDGSLLLCEDCGYQLDGLPRSASCPECGRALEASHPDGRVGSRWQQRPGFVSWLATCWAVLRHPKGVWSEIKVESRRSVALMLINFAVGSALATIGIALGGAQFRPASAVYMLVFYVVAFDLLLLLTLIESVGIRTFAKRRKWRVTRRVADAVCGHASVGWILAGLGLALGWHAAQFVEVEKVASWIVGVAGQRYVPGRDELAAVILIAVMGGGLMVGLLTFEWLVFFGVRRMKFANAPGSGFGAGTATLVPTGGAGVEVAAVETSGDGGL